MGGGLSGICHWVGEAWIHVTSSHALRCAWITGTVLKPFSLPIPFTSYIMPCSGVTLPEQTSYLVSLLNVINKKAAGGGRQLSSANPLASNEEVVGAHNGAQHAPGRSSASAWSCNPHELADKHWYDSCISATCCKGVCGGLQDFFCEFGRDVTQLNVYRLVFLQKRSQWFLCHNLLSVVCPRDLPVLVAAVGNCS